MLVFQIWEASDYKVLPRPGGIGDQDPDLIEDLLHCLWLKAYHRQRLAEPEKKNTFEEVFGGRVH